MFQNVKKQNGTHVLKICGIIAMTGFTFIILLLSNTKYLILHFNTFLLNLFQFSSQ